MTFVKLDESKKLKAIIDPLVNISEEVFIEISDKGLRAQAADIGKSWMGDVYLAKSEFSQIEIDGESKLYSIRLKDLADFLKTAQSSEEFELRENQNDGTLDLMLTSDVIDKKMQLRLKQIPKDHRFMQILNKDFQTNCEIQADLLSQAIKATELGGDQVHIIHTRENIFFKAEGSLSSSEVTISYDNENANVGAFADNPNSDDGAHSAIYKMDYLKIAVKVGKSDDIVKLSMDDSGPLRVVYSLSENEDQNATSYIAFAIAPRVKE